jgi:hypothetical protein
METFYLICAGLGGTLIVLQFLASAVGFHLESDHDLDHETDHDHDSSHGSFLGLLTLRSVSAAIAFFGLAGLSANSLGAAPLGTLGAAVLGGFAALYAVVGIMNFFKTLKHDGTARLERAVGATGTVYLRIPGGNAAPGKVTLNLQNRTVECEAYSGEEIPTGRTVRVLAVRGANAVDVGTI